MFPIPETLLLRLPCQVKTDFTSIFFCFFCSLVNFTFTFLFQVIECNLVGIQPDFIVTPEILRSINNFCSNKYVYVFVVNSNETGELTGGKKFCVNILNLTGKSLNKYLIVENLVTAEESEIEYVKDVETRYLRSGADSEESGWLDSGSNLNSDKPSEGSLFEKKPEKDLDKYLLEMSDDLFENEDEKSFLKSVILFVAQVKK